ncbi:hypothetical protein M1O56_00275 [Dehalococcoidia bacterium]|nr:hypothetical protein [Dehalococcoidia bacterium]
MIPLIAVAIVVAGAVGFFYFYTRFLLERKTDLRWGIFPAILYAAQAYFRLPIVYSVFDQILTPIDEILAPLRGEPLALLDLPFFTLLWVIFGLLLVPSIFGDFVRGIWFLPFKRLRRDHFTSLVSVLELGAIIGMGSLIGSTILIGFLVRDPSWSWALSFVGERLTVIIAYMAIPILHLHTIYAYKRNGRSALKGWALGYLKAMALHTFINSSILWLWFRDVHWSIMPLFQVHFVVAILVAFVCWHRIYRRAEEEERQQQLPKIVGGSR